MGINFSVPKPVKLGFDGILQYSNDTIILNSTDYKENVKWLTKACNALANNKKIKKIIYKFYFNELGSSKLTQAIGKSMNNRESIIIYGTNLIFLEDLKWIEIWSSLAIEVIIT